MFWNRNTSRVATVVTLWICAGFQMLEAVVANEFELRSLRTLQLLRMPDLDVYSKETMDACAIAKQVPAGCSVLGACTDAKFNKGFCTPQSIWNDVCSDDLEILRRDGVCERYQDKCIESQSDECQSGLPSLPKTSEVRALIREICLEMPKMKECANCRTGECAEPFMSAYVPLCASMPGMHECSPWRNLCTLMKETQIKLAWKCPTKAHDNDPPPMQMYLHFSLADYILFSWWVPRTYFSYALACFLCFVLGVTSSTIKIARARFETHWSASEEDHIANHEAAWFSPPSFKNNTRRAVMVGVISFLDFVIMLLVMSFNVGIIVSSVFGLAFGHLLFGHMTRHRTVPTCCAPD